MRKIQGTLSKRAWLPALGLIALLAYGCATCKTDAGCPVGSLCEQGRCQQAVCPEIFQPVCGVDGKTYSNRCQAKAAHVEVAKDGECGGTTGEVCGGIRGLRCPEEQICDLPAGTCRSADLQGVCLPRPGACPRIFKPVCGCDGQTYSNDCERLRAGAQKDHDGECTKAAGGGS